MPFKANSPGCPCCQADCLWTFVTRGCNDSVFPGCTVTVSQDGETIDSCVTDSQVTALNLVSGGSGYTNGTGYALGFSGGGGSGAAGTFDVVGGAVTSLVLTAPGSGYTSAPTISFPGAGPGTGATATATVAARCTLNAPQGPFDVEVVPPSGLGYATTETSLNHNNCDALSTITLSPDEDHVCVPCCNRPVSKTLYTSDGLGTHELTWGGVAWSGSAIVTEEVYINATPTCMHGNFMTVTYGFSCQDNNWRLGIEWHFRCCGEVPVGFSRYLDDSQIGTLGAFVRNATDTVPAEASDCGNPFSVTFDMPTEVLTPEIFCFSESSPPVGGTGHQTPGGGGTMVVTE